jgi:methyl-accepting chemotaxis protein
VRWSSSLSTRLVMAVLATATVAFGVSTGLTVLQLNQSLKRQAEQLGKLSEQKLADDLDAQARLLGARIDALFNNIGRRLESISQRADVGRAISTGNVVEISELLGRAARAADLDGIIVVDAKLRVFGAGREDLDIVATNQALNEHPLAKEILPYLEDNDRKRPRILRKTVPLTPDLVRAIGAIGPTPLAAIYVEPIFDDFGDVLGALIGYRGLKPRETALLEFSELEGSGVLVLDGDHSISSAGLADATIAVTAVDGMSLLRSSDGAYWARCDAVFERWRICSLARLAELHTFRDELVRIGEMEGRSLVIWLFIVAVLSLMSFTAITLWTSRRITRPLAHITEAVIAVARGDWKSQVSGAERRDEVGDIARAVVVLQRSLEERDRLRSDVLYAETVNKRRETLEDAIRRFDRMMRSLLLGVSDCVETMDETAKELARMSSVAQGEAAEAAFVSDSTVSNVSTVRTATERLSASIAETAERLRETADAITAASSVAQSAAVTADGLTATTDEFDGVVHFIEEVAAQINTVALNATIQASRAGESAGAFGAVVADVRGLAERMTKTNGDVAGRMARMRAANVEAAEAVRSIVQRLGLLVRQTMTVALAMERQDEVTRQIVGAMTAAANGSINVSTSVGRLKSTIEEARETSMKVVTKAADMADEAHRLDLTVKSFLREVTA